MNVNFIKHVRAVFMRMQADTRITPHHISLYLALFLMWNEKLFARAITLDREEVMERAKIGSKNTYFKCIAELSFWNYITYFPTRVKHRPSTVVFRRFDNLAGANLEDLYVDDDILADARKELAGKRKSKKARSKPVTSSTDTTPSGDHTPTPGLETDTPADQNPLLPSPNSEIVDGRHVGHLYTNTSNEANLSLNQTTDEEQVLTDSDFGHDRPSAAAAQASKEKSTGAGRAPAAIPASLAEVREFFASISAPAHEAARFHHYYKSLGWKIGGTKPIEDWRAAAEGWLLNAPKHAAGKNTGPTPGHLQTPPQTNHAEPF